MVTLAAARRVALALPEVTEEDHHGMPSFRVRGKIFATVPGERHLRVMLDAELSRAAVRADPKALAELWWGKKLCGVTVTLARVAGDRLEALLEEAWKQHAPKRLSALHSTA
jgi:hypothetical protein